MKVLIIIPAYNEELNIEATVKDVTNNTCLLYTSDAADD